jgi:cellobiose phosphorylase
MYRLIVESLLGLTREKDRLRFTPCLPAAWPALKIHYRYGATSYEIAIRQAPSGDIAAAAGVTENGVAQADNSVRLVDDNAEHRVEVVVRAAED